MTQQTPPNDRHTDAASGSGPAPEEVSGAPGLEGFVQSLIAELREAGEVGRKQWEEAITRTRDYLAPYVEREELERQVAAVRERLARALEEDEGLVARARGELGRFAEGVRGQADAAFTQAQERGAVLLLPVVRRLRERTEELERSLKRFEDRSQPEDGPEPEAA